MYNSTCSPGPRTRTISEGTFAKTTTFQPYLNNNRQYLFSSTRPEAQKDQARRLAVAFVSFRISSSNGSSSIFLYRKGTPTTMQNHSAISLASGKTKTVPSIVVTVQPFST